MRHFQKTEGWGLRPSTFRRPSVRTLGPFPSPCLRFRSLHPFFVTSLLSYIITSLLCAARPSPRLLHCSTHGTPTPRPTLSRRSPLARRDRPRHPRFTAFHCPAPARRSALLDRNRLRTR